jgi:methyl coenzyme M reductase subunit D
VVVFSTLTYSFTAMKTIGKFKVLDSFKITGRGLVVKGEIIEGRVKTGSFTTLKINSEDRVLQIGGVEFIDNISTGEYWIGLSFFYTTDIKLKEIEDVKLVEQLVDIFEVE